MKTLKTLGLDKALIALLLAAAALPPAAGAEETLGRLFFTPERRQSLERQRKLNNPETMPVNEDPTLTVNGVVTRSSGKRTSWVNGVPQNENEPPGGTAVVPRARDPGKVLLQTGDLPPANVRVGETLDRNTGESGDLLNEGRIVVKRPSAR